MNPIRVFLLALAALLILPFAGVSRASGAEVSFDYFYESLSPYGEWVETVDYGYCWRPGGIDEGWAPYTDGYWVYTDAGWTWVSYEDFGPITYHYGRWVRLDGLGWVWKPDYEWAPAWVSWRYNDDYIGWAPLPPEALWDASVGISVWIDRDCDIGPGYYSFCETRYFGAPVLRNVLVSRSLNLFLINRTVNITSIRFDRDRAFIYNGGPDYHRISGRTQRHIERFRLDRRTSREGRGIAHPRRAGGALIVQAPVIARSQHASRPAQVNRRFEKAKADRGWSGVADPAERRRTQEKIRAEVQGRTRQNTPAAARDDKRDEKKDDRGERRDQHNQRDREDRREGQERDGQRNRDDRDRDRPSAQPQPQPREDDARKARQAPQEKGRRQNDRGDRNRDSRPAEPQQPKREDEARRAEQAKQTQMEEARRQGEQARERAEQQQRDADARKAQQSRAEEARRQGEQARERAQQQQRDADARRAQQSRVEEARRQGEQARERAQQQQRDADARRAQQSRMEEQMRQRSDQNRQRSESRDRDSNRRENPPQRPDGGQRQGSDDRSRSGNWGGDRDDKRNRR